MRMQMAAFLALLASIPAHAEIISLICEHEGGISSVTGRPNAGGAKIFRVDFDTNKNKVVTPNFAAFDVTFSVTDYSVSWRYNMPAENAVYRYELNRSTGTLFVNVTTANDSFVASGRCNKPKRIL